MDFKELEDLIRILEQSGLAELEIEEDGRRIRLQKSQPLAPAGVAMVPLDSSSLQPIAAGMPVEPEPEEADETQDLPTINAPMVGTFYAAPAPGEEPFVNVGDTVEEGQMVCIIEAMKLMNEVSATLAGVVEKILVENGQPVEFGQALFSIRTLEAE